MFYPSPQVVYKQQLLSWTQLIVSQKTNVKDYMTSEQGLLKQKGQAGKADT